MSAYTATALPLLNVKNNAPFTSAHNSRRVSIFTKHIRLVSGLLFAALSASLTAETHFCVGGDLDDMTPASIRACQAKMAEVRDVVKHRGAPAGWHFVVVCDEAGWKEYARFSRQERGLLSGVSYSTDPNLRWTFLRGTELNVDQPEAVAEMLSTALESVPEQKNAHPLAPSRTQRQLSIAMADPDISTPGSE